MDPDRDPTECCAKNTEDSFVAYNDYHLLIEKYFKEQFMLNNFKPFKQALLIDLHSTDTRDDDLVKIGYLLSNKNLKTANLTKYQSKSSLGYLAMTSPFSFDEIIRGDLTSFGGIMETLLMNVSSVPSPKNPSTIKDEDYLRSGYIISKHSSKIKDRYRINGIQLELALKMSSNLELIGKYANNIAATIFQFYSVHNLGDTLNRKEMKVLCKSSGQVSMKYQNKIAIVFIIEMTVYLIYSILF
jgi:hypothetical protein